MEEAVVRFLRDPVGHFIYWRRLERAGDWRRKRRSHSVTREQADRNVRNGQAAARINAAMIVAESAILANLFAAVADDCVHRTYLINAQKVVVFVMAISALGASCGVLTGLAEDIFVQRERNLSDQQFPRVRASILFPAQWKVIFKIQSATNTISYAAIFFVILALAAVTTQSTVHSFAVNAAKVQKACGETLSL